MPDHHDRRLRACVALGLSSNTALTAVISMHTEAIEVPMRPWLYVTAAVAASVSLLGFAAGLDDLLARHRDRSPSRGGYPLTQSIIFTVGSLMLAFFAAAAMGRDPSFTALAVATLLLVHLAATRYIPAAGLLVQAAVAAGLMLIPDWRMDLPAAVWVTMSVTLLTAVGVHRLSDQRPVLSFRGVPMVVLGWMIMTAIILGLRPAVGMSIWPDGFHPGRLVWPMVAVVILGLIVRWRLAGARADRRAAGGVVRAVALGQPMLAASWCAAMDMMFAAILFLVVAIGGAVLSGAARDVAGMLSPQGPGWRR